MVTAFAPSKLLQDHIFSVAILRIWMRFFLHGVDHAPIN